MIRPLGPPLILALALTACTGAAPDPGLDLDLRIPDAQLVRAPFPSADLGPEVTFVDAHAPTVTPGEARKLVEGRAGADSYALAVGLAGDRGYWRVPVGLEDPAVPGELSFSLRLDFSRDLRPGDAKLLLQATDRIERGGPLREVPLEVLSPIPQGELVIALEWDVDADVDLYVTDPDGVTLGPKNGNTYEPPAPGEPPDDPDAWRAGGVLDADSNANCVIDGRRRENAIWTEPPPAGRYRIAVDLAAPCGQARAGFRVIALLAGEEIARASGVLYESDARETASGGAAPLLVTDFDVP